MNKNIPIFYAADENYAPYLAVSIASLIDNASKKYTYDINIVNQGLTKETKDKLKKLKTKNVRIKFFDMNKTFQNIPDMSDYKLNGNNFTLTIFFRIFIANMFFLCNKAIYIDCDTIISGDISKMYEIDLGNNLIGGVEDKSIQANKTFVNYIEKYVGVPINKYINSGVLLMNLQKLRKVKFDKKFIYLLDKYHFDTVAPDQDYINAMCLGRIKYLDYSWNSMPGKGVPKVKKPNIIHYNLQLKPWHYKVMYDEYFWKYAKKSDFYKEIKREKNNFTYRSAIVDKMHLFIMVKNAKNMMKKDLSFKRAFESLGEKRL